MRLGCKSLLNILPVSYLGLDARAALVVVDAIKRLAMSGRTIICTIHQPSRALFDYFDSLLLLKTGTTTEEINMRSFIATNIHYLSAPPKVLNRAYF